MGLWMLKFRRFCEKSTVDTSSGEYKRPGRMRRFPPQGPYGKYASGSCELVPMNYGHCRRVLRNHLPLIGMNKVGRIEGLGR